MLTQEDIDYINYLVLGGDCDKAIELLVEKTSCNHKDAMYFVDELSAGGNFEELLSKYWIEDYSKSKVIQEGDFNLSKKEILSILKIFVPVFVVIIIFIVLLIVY